MKLNKSRYWMFSLCLTSPMIFSIIRKLVPGQPNFIDAASIMIIIFVWGLIFNNRHSFPKWAHTPLLIWAFIQFMYAIPSIIYDYRIGLSAIGTRILPMLMVPIAYYTIRNCRDIQLSTLWICYLALPFLFISIYVSIYGNHSLPMILRPSEVIIYLGKDINKGQIYTASAIFATPTQLGYFGLIVLVLVILNATISSFRKTRFMSVNLLMLGVSGILLAYLSGRRIFLYLSIIMVSLYFVMKKEAIVVLIAILTFIAIIEIDNKSVVVGKSIEKRSDIILKSDRQDMTFYETLIGRFDNVFLHWTRENLSQAFIGSFLGSRGREAIALGYYKYGEDTGVEVGAAQLAYEMGFIGLLLMPTIVLYLIINLYKRSKHLQFKIAIRLLTTFFALMFINYYTKGLGLLTTNGMWAYFFWSIPGLCLSLIDISQRSKCKLNQNLSQC